MTTEQMDDVDAQRAGFKDAADQKAQRVMREEMEAGAHKPVKVSDVLDDILGPIGSDADVTRMAHLLIEEHCMKLKLGLGQWSMIQAAVEAAIRVDPRDL